MHTYMCAQRVACTHVSRMLGPQASPSTIISTLGGPGRVPVLGPLLCPRSTQKLEYEGTLASKNLEFVSTQTSLHRMQLAIQGLGGRAKNARVLTKKLETTRTCRPAHPPEARARQGRQQRAGLQAGTSALPASPPWCCLLPRRIGWPSDHPIIPPV